MTTLTPGIEIERRFKLLVSASRLSSESALVSQWYLPGTGSWTARCRMTTPRSGESSYTYTMKKDTAELNASLTELEFTVMRQHTHPVGVQKERYHKHNDEFLWELDVFRNSELSGLEIAEVELPSLYTPISIPIWIGTEITNVRCLSNISLSRFLNNPQEQLEAAEAVCAHFSRVFDGHLSDLGKVNITSFFKSTDAFERSRRFVADLVKQEYGCVSLNQEEIVWLSTDDSLTLLDLTLYVAFCRRKNKKNKAKA